MNDKTAETLAELASDIQSVSKLGGVLRAAREKRGVEIEEVARTLCMGVRQLEAIENDNVNALPAPAFTRGFIRNYARFLGLSAEPLLAAYRDMLPQGSENSSISLSSKGIPIFPDQKSWIYYLIVALLVCLVAGAWLAYPEWMARRQSTLVDQPLEQPAEAPVLSTEDMTTSQITTDQAGIMIDLMPEQSPAQEMSPAVNSENSYAQAIDEDSSSSTAVTPVANSDQLRLIVTEESWVRIVDGHDEEIFSNIIPANSEKQIIGKRPFKIEIGNVSGVELIYLNQPVDLSPHTKANVARFTLD